MKSLRLFVSISSFLVLLIIYASIVNRPSQSDRLINKTNNEFARKMKKEKELYLLGTGAGENPQMSAVHFEYYHKIDLGKARELLVSVVDEYLSVINKNEKFKPYIRKYPFKAKNVEVRISVQNPDGSEPTTGELTYISALEGILTYYLRGEGKYKMDVVHEETYEEAVQALKSQPHIENSEPNTSQQ